MNQIKHTKSQILIVDDNPRNIEVAATLLKDDYRVETALSGDEALFWADEQRFDLVLLDIMMPGMDGYETCRQLKQKPGYDAVPVVFLTAKTDLESLEQAFSVGGADYVAKPFRPRELMARVQTHIDLMHRTKALDELNQKLEEKVAQRTSELREANENLQIAMRELEELDQAKSEFLRMASHEIRTPLNGIVGVVDLMKDNDEVPPEFADYLEMMEISAKRLERFSIQALEITQMHTKGEKLFDYQDFFLDDFEKAFIKTYLRKNHITDHEVEMDLKVHAQVHADPRFLEKIFDIVMDNAMEVTPEGQPIHCEMHEAGGKIVCTIRDHGPGFPESMLNGTLGQYVPGIQHEDQHTGLNLQFVRMTLHKMHGELQLENHPDGGAVVRIILPLGK
jgi:two-component system sensor histidine kinase/response regulator